MENKFNNRVFGAVLIRADIANYNADFTGSPRTLPNGVVYATDKALKYAIRNYLKHNNGELVFYTTRYKKDNMQPLDIDETYRELFGEYPKTVKDFSKTDKNGKTNWQKEKEKNFQDFDVVEETGNFVILNKDDKQIILIDSDDRKRKIILQNLLKALDIRLFGATFASSEGNLSIHGNAQITHGINIYGENNICTEDITSPFRNSNANSEESQQTTIGNQTFLEEGHYLHNFTINPKNSEELIKLIDDQGYLTNEDIEKFKDAINRGVSYYDSASKIGVENEFSIFVTLKENEKIQLPLFTTLIKTEKKEDSFKRDLDLSELKKMLESVKDSIEKVEIYIDTTKLNCKDEIFEIPNVCVKSIISGKEINKNENR